MAANSARSVILLSLLTLTANAAIGADKIQAEAAALAGENLTRLFISLSETMTSCRQKSKVIKIPHSGDAGMSRNDLLLGLGYLYLKNRNECIAPAAKEFFLAARVLQEGMTQATGGKDFSEAFELVDVILEEWWRELEARARYHAQVAEANRARIEKLPGVDGPFDMIRSWEASGN